MKENTLNSILIIVSAICVIFTIATLISPNDEIIYDEAYEKGYWVGYDEGYCSGNEDGVEDGYEIGYGDGYDEGYDEGSEFGWMYDKDIMGEIGRYIEEEAVHYTRDLCEYHPLDEALDIIECYRNNSSMDGNAPPTKSEYEDALDSVVEFCNYFYYGQYLY